MSKKNRQERRKARLSDKETELLDVVRRKPATPAVVLRSNDNPENGATAPKELVMDKPKKQNLFRRIGAWVKSVFTRKAVVNGKKSLVRKTASTVAYPFKKAYQGAAFVVSKAASVARFIPGGVLEVLGYVWYAFSRLAVLTVAILAASLLLAIAEPVLQVILGVVALAVFFRVIAWIVELAADDANRHLAEPEDEEEEPVGGLPDNLHVAASS